MDAVDFSAIESAMTSIISSLIGRE